MRFIKGHMATIDGVSIYPIISLLIFFVFFSLLFWWVFAYKDEDIEKISNIPFNKDNNNDILL